MKGDIFQNPTKSIPKGDSRVVRIDFSKEDMGARKSHLPRNIKNDLSIQHVKGA